MESVMNLYVSNIAYEITEYDLREMFAPYGPTKVVLVKERFTGKSRGYGFVDIANEETCKKLIKHFNGKDFYGKIMSVSVARPRADKDNKPNKKGKHATQGSVTRGDKKNMKNNSKVFQFDRHQHNKDKG